MMLNRGRGPFAAWVEKRVPGQLVIQFTDQCNARCPQCGMRVIEKFPRSTLSSDQVRIIIDAAAEKGIQAVSFTGGEPMLYFDEVAQLIRHAGAAGIPYIRTGTNGFFFMNSSHPGFEGKITRIAETLAKTPLRNFWISIDSALPAVHEVMRGFPGVIAGIEKALPIFHDCGIYPSANLGINRNITEKTMRAGKNGGGDFYYRFQEAFREFYRVIIGLGFTIVNCCYPMSIDEPSGAGDLHAVYAASSTDEVVCFSAREKALLFKALLDVIPEFRSRVRIFSPRSSLYSLINQYTGDDGAASYACRGGIDFFFIDARDGNAYPCGYRGGGNFGNFQELDLKSLDAEATCRECDWECFRDPSALFGPLLEARTAPLELLKTIGRDPQYFRLWMDDLRYYHACGLFDGRRPPDFKRLKQFQPAR